MKLVNTVAGKPYTVTTSADCTVSTADGLLISTCTPGQQGAFIAPGDAVMLSADEAHLTETEVAAFTAVAASRAHKELKKYVTGKTDELSRNLADLSEGAQEAIRDAQAASGHALLTAPHLQAGEREKWNAAILPVGTILTSACAAMSGFLLCDGQAVSRTEYAALYAAIGDTYGAGDGESTFNVPDLRGRVMQGADEVCPLGTTIEAGLPNIEGAYCAQGLHYGQGIMLQEGAFYSNAQKDTMTNGVSAMTAINGNAVLRFDASRSNATYGASDTVQPPAVALNHFIKH